ncbi:unnamed protein product [Closterium sp. NIES-54]
MNVYVASRRSARRLLWLVLPLTSRPFLGSIPGFTAFETSQTHRIASRFSVPSLPSLDRIGSNPNEPARNASSQLRGFGPPQETFSSHVRSFAAWSVVGASSRPADAEASEAETSIFGSESLPRSKPLITVQADLKTRTVQDEEREDGGGGRRSIRKVKGEEKGGGDERVEWVIAGNAAGKSEGGKRKSNRTGACKEEEEAVAVIAGVLREKFGPQIVREVEELGSGMRSSENDERVKVKEEEEGEEGDDEEAEEEEDEDDAEGETCEEDSPPTTSPPTHPPQLYNRRVVSPSSLLSLYRFFSSHLGISSPSTVASLLVTYPQLLRSNPTNDFLPRVRLLQSYGISHADIAHVTVKAPPWLRVPLEQIQNTLEFLLAQGVHRSRLGLILRRTRRLLWWEARSTSLDILVEKAGVPVDKLGGMIVRYPDILTWGKEALNTQLEALSAYFEAGCGTKVEAGSTSTGLLKQRQDEPHRDTSHLSRLIVKYPVIFSRHPHHIAESIAILQSFTPPGTPSIASSVLRRAPSIFSLSKEYLLAKLQFFVELVGEEAAGRMVRSRPQVLQLSKDNVQGKVATLADLIGQENSMRLVARSPVLVTTSEDCMKDTFRELVREVEEALERSGDVGNETQVLGKGDSAVCLEGGNHSRALSSALSSALSGNRCRARQLVVDLVMKFPPCITFSWKTNLKPKVEYLKRDMGLTITEVLAYPPFPGFSLDRRIRPRHEALVRMGYEVVAHKVVIRTSAGKQRAKLGSVCSSLSDEVGGVEGIDWGAEERKSGRTGAVGGPVLWALLFTLVSIKPGAGEETAGGIAELAAAAGAAGGGGGDSVSATAFLLGPLLLPDGTGGGVAATAASATAVSASSVSASAIVALPLQYLLQLFLWVVVSPGVAEGLLFRGWLLTDLQERLGRMVAGMLSAALSALLHLSLSLLFPNMALGRRPAPPSRPAATTAAAAARATAAAGGGAAGSTGAARGGQQRSLPLPDDPTPQQLREGVIQRGSLGGGGFGFMWPQRPCDCASQRCVPGRVEAAALGSSESAVAPGAGESAAALGARESAVALGASASTATGPASTEALHTFTLDSGASHFFFRDCTTVTPLAAPIPVSLADPTGGPVAERASTGP